MDSDGKISLNEYEFRQEVIQRLTRVETSLDTVVSSINNPSVDSRLDSLEATQNKLKGAGIFMYCLIGAFSAYESIIHFILRH